MLRLDLDICFAWIMFLSTSEQFVKPVFQVSKMLWKTTSVEFENEQ